MRPSIQRFYSLMHAELVYKMSICHRTDEGFCAGQTERELCYQENSNKVNPPFSDKVDSSFSDTNPPFSNKREPPFLDR